MKARELHCISNIVEKILREEEATRNSDDLLYVSVCRTINPDAVRQPVALVLGDRKRFGLPAYESVRRARQKIQENGRRLAPCEEVGIMRTENEGAYRSFARGQ